MNMDYSLRISANGKSFIAKLSERDGWCKEIVFTDGEQTHYAEFPASNLGAGDRGTYLHAMAKSMAAKYKREGN